MQKYCIFYKPCKHIYMLKYKFVYMTTNIRISKYNRDKLNELKQKGEYNNLDEVITHLITVNEKFENSEIVRLVRKDV